MQIIISSNFKISTQKSDRSASSRLDSSSREDPVNYNEKVEKIHDRGLSYKESIDGDALYVQSQPLYDHHDDRIAEPVVIVEDVTGTTPPDIPLSLNVVPRVEEELAEGFQSDGDIEVESTGREYESEVTCFLLVWILSVYYISFSGMFYLSDPLFFRILKVMTKT